MKTIAEIKYYLEIYIKDSKKCEDCKKSKSYCKDHFSLINEERTILSQAEEICKLIKKDIKYQKTKLTGDFEKDKPILWRIIGMKDLIKRIEGSGIYNKDIRKPKQSGRKGK